MFPWVFWATAALTYKKLLGAIPALGGFDGPAPLLWADHSLCAATVCYCGTAKCQCCHELQIWMNIESARWISWLLNTTESAHGILYIQSRSIKVQFPCILLHCNPYGMINILTYMIMLSRINMYLLVISRYMYMLWPVYSWANDDVREYDNYSNIMYIIFIVFIVIINMIKLLFSSSLSWKLVVDPNSCFGNGHSSCINNFTVQNRSELRSRTKPKFCRTLGPTYVYNHDPGYPTLGKLSRMKKMLRKLGRILSWWFPTCSNMNGLRN